MFVCWVISHPEDKRRIITVVTTSAHKHWLMRIRALPYLPEVEEVNVFRSCRNEIPCYDISVTVDYDPANCESDEWTIHKTFGQVFVDEHLPLHTAEEMGPLARSFVRMSNKNDDDTGLTFEDSLFVIYDTIELNNKINLAIYKHCCKKFSEMTNKMPKANLMDNADVFNTLAKKHNLEGGGWFLKPDQDTAPEDVAYTSQMYFHLLLLEFARGSLTDSYMTRVTCTRATKIVKVFHEKTVFFDQVSARSTTKSSTDEDIYRLDMQANTTYRKIINMKLPNITLKYVPEVVTACKLTLANSSGPRCLYSGISHTGKMANSK